MKTTKKIVVKLGTSSLTQGTSKLSRRYMLGLVQQFADLQSQGLQLVLVSSGAVSTGREVLNFFKIDHSSFSKQTLAAIGQIKLMQVWSELFSIFNIHIGQVLFTKNNFSSQNRNSARRTLNSLLKQNIIPIINENDTITTKETRVGDNDNLAALVAELINADTIILLTDQEGLFTADPRLDPKAELIPIVERIDEKIFALAGHSSSILGTGGMITKIQAAQNASKSGIQTIIASSSRQNVLIDLLQGKQIGTLFLKKSKTKKYQ